MNKKQQCSHCKNMYKGTQDENNYKTHSIKNCPKLLNTICFNCHEVGHTPKYCTKPKDICILCQQIGHNEKNCGYQSQIFSSPIDYKCEYVLDFEVKSWSALNNL